MYDGNKCALILWVRTTVIFNGFYLFILTATPVAWDLSSSTGEADYPALEEWSLNHWATEVPRTTDSFKGSWDSQDARRESPILSEITSCKEIL